MSSFARVTLAGIRIFNGTAGLLAPSMLSRKLDAEEAAGPMSYPFRMFGIRTILIGVDLLSRDPEVRRHAVRQAPLVHASDTISAWTAGKLGALPPKAAKTATTISAVNLVLALLANRRAR
ncbi:MAG TPA: hypothetical protein VK488_03630 [Gaiellaceae bacterium]|nr:hypothetical protein [Gaiellaceae bacterium]